MTPNVDIKKAWKMVPLYHRNLCSRLGGVQICDFRACSTLGYGSSPTLCPTRRRQPPTTAEGRGEANGLLAEEAALAALGRPHTLLCGGEPKRLPLDSLASAAARRIQLAVTFGAGAADRLQLEVARSPLDPALLRLTWPSTPGKVYDVLINADLSSPRESWDGLAGSQDIPADLSGTNTLDIALPFPGQGFVAIREKNAPPLFFDDLESGTGGWTTVVNDANGNTQWEFGTPNGSPGPIAGADGSANAWCTGRGD